MAILCQFYGNYKRNHLTLVTMNSLILFELLPENYKGENFYDNQHKTVQNQNLRSEHKSDKTGHWGSEIQGFFINLVILHQFSVKCSSRQDEERPVVVVARY